MKTTLIQTITASIPPEKRFSHKFEEVGLGVAPFRLVVVQRGDWGSCDYCSTAIKEHCFIRDRNGKIFVVGNECVRHTGDAGLIDEVKRAVNKVRTEERHEKEAAKIAEGEWILADNENLRTILSLKPHPYLYRSSKGDTLLDFVNWNLKNAGNKGKLEVVKIIQEYKDHIPTEADRLAYQAARQRSVDEVRRQDEEDKRLEAERQAKIEAIRKSVNAEIIGILKQQPPSTFVNDMVLLLEQEPLSVLSERQFAVICDICARQKGRRGSREYNAEASRIRNLR